MRWSPARPPRPGCPHRRLSVLLARELPKAVVPAASTFRPWASASFIGARHIFPCRIEPAAGGTGAMRADLQQRLSAIEWRLPGHIVADVVVERSDDPHSLRIEILTVED
jgi:hypothetical protein